MASKIPVGTRIRMVDGWPERIGAEGVVVDDPNGPGVYPCDKKHDYIIIVLLDDDPLVPPERRHPGWSCALDDTDWIEIVKPHRNAAYRAPSRRHR
jgi:hypothetical protein